MESETDLSASSDAPPELQFNSDDEPPCPYTGEVTVISPDADVFKTILALGEGHIEAGYGDEVCVRWKEVSPRSLATPKGREGDKHNSHLTALAGVLKRSDDRSENIPKNLSLLPLQTHEGEGVVELKASLGYSESLPQLISLAIRHMRKGEIALVTGPSHLLRTPQKYLYTPHAISSRVQSLLQSKHTHTTVPSSSSSSSSSLSTQVDFSCSSSSSLCERNLIEGSMCRDASPLHSSPPVSPPVSSSTAYSIFYKNSLRAKRRALRALRDSSQAAPSSTSSSCVKNEETVTLEVEKREESEGSSSRDISSMRETDDPKTVGEEKEVDLEKQDRSLPSTSSSLQQQGSDREVCVGGAFSQRLSMRNEERKGEAPNEKREKETPLHAQDSKSHHSRDLANEEGRSLPLLHRRSYHGEEEGFHTCSPSLSKENVPQEKHTSFSSSFSSAKRSGDRKEVEEPSCAVVLELVSVHPVRSLCEDGGIRVKVLEAGRGKSSSNSHDLVTCECAILRCHHAKKHRDEEEGEEEETEGNRQGERPRDKEREDSSMSEESVERSSKDGDQKVRELEKRKKNKKRREQDERNQESSPFLLFKDVSLTDLPFYGLQTAVRYMKEGEVSQIYLKGPYARILTLLPPSSFISSCSSSLSSFLPPCCLEKSRGRTEEKKRERGEVEARCRRRKEDQQDGLERNEAQSDSRKIEEEKEKEEKEDEEEIQILVRLLKWRARDIITLPSPVGGGGGPSTSKEKEEAKLFFTLLVPQQREGREGRNKPREQESSSFSFSSERPRPDSLRPLHGDEERRVSPSIPSSSSSSVSSCFFPHDWRPGEGSTVLVYVSLSLLLLPRPLSSPNLPSDHNSKRETSLSSLSSPPFSSSLHPQPPVAIPLIFTTTSPSREAEEEERRLSKNLPLDVAKEEEEGDGGAWIVFTLGEWEVPLWLEEIVKKLKGGEVGKAEMSLSTFRQAVYTLDSQPSSGPSLPALKVTLPSSFSFSFKKRRDEERERKRREEEKDEVLSFSNRETRKRESDRTKDQDEEKGREQVLRKRDREEKEDANEEKNQQEKGKILPRDTFSHTKSPAEKQAEGETPQTSKEQTRGDVSFLANWSDGLFLLSIHRASTFEQKRRREGQQKEKMRHAQEKPHTVDKEEGFSSSSPFSSPSSSSSFIYKNNLYGEDLLRRKIESGELKAVFEVIQRGRRRRQGVFTNQEGDKAKKRKEEETPLSLDHGNNSNRNVSVSPSSPVLHSSSSSTSSSSSSVARLSSSSSSFEHLREREGPDSVGDFDSKKTSQAKGGDCEGEEAGIELDPSGLSSMDGDEEDGRIHANSPFISIVKQVKWPGGEEEGGIDLHELLESFSSLSTPEEKASPSTALSIHSQPVSSSSSATETEDRPGGEKGRSGRPFSSEKDGHAGACLCKEEEEEERTEGERIRVVATVWLAGVIDQRKEHWAMTDQEKRAYIHQQKQTGNALFKKGWLAAASRRYSAAFDVCRFLPVYMEAMEKKKKMNPQILHPNISRTGSATQQKQNSLFPSTGRRVDRSQEKREEEEEEEKEKEKEKEKEDKNVSVEHRMPPTPSLSQSDQDKPTECPSQDINQSSSTSSSTSSSSFCPGKYQDRRLTPSSGVGSKRVETTCPGEEEEDEEGEGDEIGLIELSKTACNLLNNVALCCLKQSQWRQALQHAETSLLLIDIGEQKEREEEADREEEEEREREEEKIEERPEEQLTKARMDRRMKEKEEEKEEEKEKDEGKRSQEDISQERSLSLYGSKNADPKIERREESNLKVTNHHYGKKKKNSIKKKKNSHSSDLRQSYEDLKCVALYRKARALEMGGDIQRAIGACKEALKIHPGDSHLRVLSKSLYRQRAREIESENSVFRGMFNRHSPPPPRPAGAASSSM